MIVANLNSCKYVQVMSLHSSSIDMELDVDSDDISDLHCGYDDDFRFFIVTFTDDEDRKVKQLFPANLVHVDIRA